MLIKHNKLCLLLTICTVGGVIMTVLQFKKPRQFTPRPNERISSTTEVIFKPRPVEKSQDIQHNSVTDLPHWSSLWTDKIHLCVMFNLKKMKPKKEVVDLLVSYYYPFFRNITLIFDGVNERPKFVPDFVDVIGCDSHDGWYQHKCIRSCIQGGTKETKGHLYIADDMFINLTKMADLPSTKLWFVHMTVKKYSWLINPGPEGWREWMWWNTNKAKALQKVINSFPTEWIEQLKETGFPDLFKVKAISDIIYIPGDLVQNMAKVLGHIIRTARLHCEIATPLALDIVAPERITLNYGYLWFKNRSNTTELEHTARSAHFVHPLKLATDPQHRKLWTQYMKQQLHNFNMASSRLFGSEAVSTGQV